jgi:uncharacterized membrane-anchored protein YitT (DUF2179 family)
MGLALGKKLLVADSFLGPDTTSRTHPATSPRQVYFWSSLLANGCLLGASFLVEIAPDFQHSFLIYVVLMGYLNGMFSGVAYIAPMLAC